MTFFYETFPIFLCGLAAGIVLTALVGWVIRGDSGNADFKRYGEYGLEEGKVEVPQPEMGLHVMEGAKKIKKNALGDYAVV